MSGINCNPLDDRLLYEIYGDYETILPSSGIGREKFIGILDFIKRHISKEEKIVEIGCGDGYLLKILRDFGYKHTYCIEPSKALSQIAEKHGVRVFNQFFTSETNLDIDIDVFILVHVLEHFKDPVSIIEKCLTLGRKIVIEVPYLCGHLHEHMFFFSVSSFQEICKLVSAKILEYEIDNYFNNYPVLRLIISKDGGLKDDANKKETYEEVLSCLHREKLNTQSQVERLISILESGGSYLLWGSGSSAIIVLNLIRDKLLELTKKQVCKILLTDSDKSRHGKFIPGIGIEVTPYESLIGIKFSGVIILSQFYREIEELARRIGLTFERIYVI
ncbi:MAG: class I SAM-dependent methyltransferase [Geminocystis sp.]|nr:class I SAM-dependent methyltransferase [Bacteroidia bacterium]MDW8302242.1 class I SAM-dependent methyltransferase [Bacteroidia bacterium]MDW8463856.1 class I SAM-dependent methyltransferase [Geminocystis sp.]